MISARKTTHVDLVFYVHPCLFWQVHMYAMVQTQSGTPYAGIKGMLRTIFGLDHLGDDAFAVKQALLKVGHPTPLYGRARTPDNSALLLRTIPSAALKPNEVYTCMRPGCT